MEPNVNLRNCLPNDYATAYRIGLYNILCIYTHQNTFVLHISDISVLFYIKLSHPPTHDIVSVLINFMHAPFSRFS